ncbi:hypothetical protein AAHA92_02625 [Salvia divinorum]|uniref:Uncharacterized protein n=1 Tax=Salvia divinorum TaxID=28513 RepID=A0ABD1IEH1_SALDI
MTTRENQEEEEEEGKWTARTIRRHRSFISTPNSNFTPGSLKEEESEETTNPSRTKPIARTSVRIEETQLQFSTKKREERRDGTEAVPFQPQHAPNSLID